MSEEQITHLIEKIDSISSFLFTQGVGYFQMAHVVYLGVVWVVGIGVLTLGKYIENRIAKEDRPVIVVMKWVIAGMFFAFGVAANLSEIVSPYGGYLTHILSGGK